MVTYTKPQQRKKEESEQLRGCFSGASFNAEFMEKLARGGPSGF